ncbi:Integrator complex subunit 7 [Papilio machaon]|uniref:Integrator complex subunit 7 n=1 Tax=Papilio machaon TaxID=76193 RepID=A0A194RED4_PAPMA|nr:Integrator complex subunit 7 [Papilio machaon]
MIGVRSNSFNDNSGEPEQDANSALTELDKGLRSGKVGEQCEAIVRFPRLFEKYPFPILINSSFLKLADVFRMGNNFLRLWVLRVCQQSEKHLDKILNVDEFLRRVFSVLHSNDPVARALALRTLGAVAGIIPERQNVHHAIRRGLESHDNVEVDAAIYATTRFAAHSNAFAVAMCNKLSDMVECESTAADRRAKLVRALRTVHGGAVRAQGVLKLLHSLLERFPSTSSVRAAISALTAIAADTVVHVPDQVELLLRIAAKEARSAVRRAALVGLQRLAEHAALWPAHCLQRLAGAAADCRDPRDAMLCLRVMQTLVRCPAVCAAAGWGCGAGAGGGALRHYCFEATLSADLRRAATAADVLTRLVVHCYEESLPVEGSDLMLALESLVIATGQRPGHIKPLRVALRCLVQLSIAEPSLYAERTAATLAGQLDAADGGGAAGEGRGRALALVEALAALGGAARCTQHLAPALPALLRAFNREGSASCEESEREDDGTMLVLVCTVMFQERAAARLRARLSRGWEQRLLRAATARDGWTRYRLARAALRSHDTPHHSPAPHSGHMTLRTTRPRRTQVT